MGLCKCPKRKVTNLFCFEHRVNVCEHCLVANHPKCIVQSYLHWLQDSDYNPSCVLCTGPLDDEVRGDCVRLLCYDVFHWSCLNDYAQRLPTNTAPAGYQCPTCKAGLFPPANVASPVAEALRQCLTTVNWARTGLGLPLIDERNASARPRATGLQQTPARPAIAATDPVGSTDTSSVPRGGGLSATPAAGSGTASAFLAAPTGSSTRLVSEEALSATSSALTSSRPVHPVQPVQSSSSSSSNSAAAAGAAYPHTNVTYPRGTGSAATGASEMSHGARKNLDGVPLAFSMTIPAADHDDNKYKRRSAFHFLSQWFRSRDNRAGKSLAAGSRMKPTYRRFLMVVVIGSLGFLTLLLVFSVLGRRVADSDPMLDPLANPNIMVRAGDGPPPAADGMPPQADDGHVPPAVR